MKHKHIIATALILTSIDLLHATESKITKKPNIVFILFDDMGYGQPQSYNAESSLRTPNLDSTSQALPVTKAQLRIGENVQEMKVEHGDKAAVFIMKVGAGMTDISTTLFDEGGKSLCSAFYVEIRKL